MSGKCAEPEPVVVTDAVESLEASAVLAEAVAAVGKSK